MKVSGSWLEFTWDLAALPSDWQQAAEPAPFRLAETPADTQLIKLVAMAVSMDNSLGGSGRILRDFFNESVARDWHKLGVRALAVFHGERMVAASAVAPGEEAGARLVSGPCVLGEYCNRGLGTLLLRESLGHLAQAGARQARGICCAHSTLAKYIYPKFGGAAVPVEVHTGENFGLEARAAPEQV